MQGIYLKLFVPEKLRHHGDLLYDWILGEAQAIGVPGGSAQRAIAGFGRHGRLHEQHFFELAGDLPIALEFFADAVLIDQLLKRLEAENVSVFYIKHAAESGLTKAG